MQELFPEYTVTKKQQLLDYIKQRHYVPTSEINRWGLDHFHIRADRDARDLAEEGRIRRLTKEEMLTSRFGHMKQGIWVFVR